MSIPVILIKHEGKWHVALRQRPQLDICSCCSLKDDCGDWDEGAMAIKTACGAFGCGFRETIERVVKEDE